MPQAPLTDLDQMLQVLADGGEQARGNLLEQLKTMVSQGSPAAVSLRASLVRILSSDAGSRVDDEEHPGSWTRSWQVSALVVVAGDDADARRLMELSTDRTREPNRWVRYWTLATACERKEHAQWAVERAGALAKDGGEDLQLRCLGWALLAEERDDRDALAALLWCLAGAKGAPPAGLEGTTDGVHALSSALRALRVLPLPQAFDQVQAIVDDAPFASYTWDAVQVLARFGGTSRAPEASHTLARFVVTNRRRREYYDMVGLAVRAIGRLGIAQTDLLMAELDSASPGVAREAAVALELLLTTGRAVERILDEATTANDRDDKRATALRSMVRPQVVDTLAAALRCGQLGREDAARRLLVELGGSVAIDRLMVRHQDLESRRKVVAEFDDRQVQHIKWIALGDGVATWISVGMWVVVFFVGVIAICGGLWLTFRQGYDVVQSVLLAGAGTVFTLLGKVGFQGRMVEVAGARAAARLAVFNGYQRRLQQVDLVLAQRFIDGVQVSAGDLRELSQLISTAQTEAQASLLALIPSEREADAYQKRIAALGQAQRGGGSGDG